ncbi:MAG TPA: hypothetical protein PKA13_18345 [Geminicoccaceae bacterium]|nr:hypothetical protein [Geminicoccus sp.]HMU51742.1 hypothetical protein [Geminicoccaceae bacterium]
MSEQGAAAASVVRAEGYRTRRAELGGWPVEITSYQVGRIFRSTIANVEPGATIARAEAESREEAERIAIGRATERLARTRTF